jgi:hypothetical protein
MRCSFSCAHLPGGVAAKGATGYWRVMPDFVAGGRFASWPRALIGGPILDVAAVIDEVFTRSVTPIPWETVVASPLNVRGVHTGHGCVQRQAAVSAWLQDRARAQGRHIRRLLAPAAAGLSPFQIKKPIRDELAVLDHDLQPVVGDGPHVFRRGVCDYHVLRARSPLVPTVNAHLNPLHPSHFSIQMRRIAWLEELIARLFLVRYPATIAARVGHVLAGGRCANPTD